MTFDVLISEIERSNIQLYSMAYYCHGQLKEHHFQKTGNCHDCYSIAKTFIMTAIGLLNDDRLLDIKKPLSFYMSMLIPKDADPAWRIITVENIMTHKIGFNEGFLDIDVEDASQYPTDDYLDMVFHHPLKYLPGQHFQYSDAAFYLLSRLITCVSGERADDFLNRRLFQPLGFREFAWSHCPYNYPIGATGLYISTADMVKLAALYLEDGLWNGRRILSENWIRKAIGNEYELHVKSANGLIGKGGMYGQMMLFNRQKDYAVAWNTHSHSEPIKKLIDFIDNNL
jgi:CubicO group peptidase (beta-lactamase class C family)